MFFILYVVASLLTLLGFEGMPILAIIGIPLWVITFWCHWQRNKNARNYALLKVRAMQAEIETRDLLKQANARR